MTTLPDSGVKYFPKPGMKVPPMPEHYRAIWAGRGEAWIPRTGAIIIDGNDIVETSETDMGAIRGNKISMIFQEPMTSWGALVNQGARQMESSPWILLFPALFLAVTLFCFNFIGDGLRDALDPKDRTNTNG